MGMIIIAFALGGLAGVVGTLTWALCVVRSKDKEDPDDMDLDDLW